MDPRLASETMSAKPFAEAYLACGSSWSWSSQWLPGFRAGLLAAALVHLPAYGATNTVTTTSDSGAGSLRAAIGLANADATTPRVINFNIPGGGVQTITLASALPAVAKATTINATTQPGYAGSPLIVLDGNSGNF